MLVKKSLFREHFIYSIYQSMGTEASPAETLPRVRLGDRQGRRIIVIHPGSDKAKLEKEGGRRAYQYRWVRL